MLVFSTGGTSGIGADLARRLADRGDEVIISGRSEARGQELIASLTGTGHAFAAFEAGDEPAWAEALTCRIGDRPLDALILNAGAPSCWTQRASIAWSICT
jgi:NAD(P)-dependent dehydrogenase (short-subunit alcohol dehydrogenase family)